MELSLTTSPTLSRRILGIDPGLHVTGYGVLEGTSNRPHVCEAGIIRPADDGANTLAARIQSVYKGIVEVINQYEPAVVVVEQLYAHYEHPRTAILMAHARGVVFLAAAEKELELISYTPGRVKKTITGHGRATKDQVQRTIQRELGLAKLPEPTDVADALAVALCHYYQQHWLVPQKKAP
jgi:crossover junction endodeoxyribonuclease RuvC